MLIRQHEITTISDYQYQFISLSKSISNSANLDNIFRHNTFTAPQFNSRGDHNLMEFNVNHELNCKQIQLLSSPDFMEPFQWKFCAWDGHLKCTFLNSRNLLLVRLISYFYYNPFFYKKKVLSNYFQWLDLTNKKNSRTPNSIMSCFETCFIPSFQLKSCFSPSHTLFHFYYRLGQQYMTINHKIYSEMLTLQF